uniref:PH domain-containing protein n=1 Tax=Macrostomum lignano TaxID=282301 RepID=A0A1I8FMD5_9PLAT
APSSTNRSTLPSNRSAKGSSGGGISDVGLPSPSDSSNREFAPEARALCWNLLDDFINWYRKGRVVIGGDTSEGVDLDGLEDESSDVVGPQLVRSQGSFKHQHPYQHQASSNSQQHRRTPSHRVCYYSPVRTPLLILLSFKIQRVLIKANIRELTLDLEVQLGSRDVQLSQNCQTEATARWPFKLVLVYISARLKAGCVQLTVHKSHASLPYNRNLSVRGINEKSSLYIGLGRIEIRIPHHPVMLHDVVQRSSKIMTLSSPPGGDRSRLGGAQNSRAPRLRAPLAPHRGAAAFAAAAAAAGGTAASSAAANPAAAAAASADRAELKEPPLRVKVKAQLAGLMIEAALNSSLCARYESIQLVLIGQVGRVHQIPDASSGSESAILHQFDLVAADCSIEIRTYRTRFGWPFPSCYLVTEHRPYELEDDIGKDDLTQGLKICVWRLLGCSESTSKPRQAVNKALVLLNYNYAKTWEKCENYFNALDREAAKTAARGYQHQHHLRPTSTAPVLANSSNPNPPSQGRPVPVQTDESSTVFLQLTDWKPEVSTVSNFDRIVFNACAVPEGSFKICSSSKNSDTELAATLVRTMLDFHWQMHGLDIHLDINIGKRLKSICSIR